MSRNTTQGSETPSAVDQTMNWAQCELQRREYAAKRAADPSSLPGILDILESDHEKQWKRYREACAAVDDAAGGPIDLYELSGRITAEVKEAYPELSDDELRIKIEERATAEYPYPPQPTTAWSEVIGIILNDPIFWDVDEESLRVFLVHRRHGVPQSENETDEEIARRRAVMLALDRAEQAGWRERLLPFLPQLHRSENANGKQQTAAGSPERSAPSSEARHDRSPQEVQTAAGSSELSAEVADLENLADDPEPHDELAIDGLTRQGRSLLSALKTGRWVDYDELARLKNCWRDTPSNEAIEKAIERLRNSLMTPRPKWSIETRDRCQARLTKPPTD